eukprot:1145730-Pelagomonas_calceolata.AAC.8
MSLRDKIHRPVDPHSPFSQTLWKAMNYSLQYLRKRRHIGSKSRESPSPEGKREALVRLVGFWQHVALRHQGYGDCFVLNGTWLSLVDLRKSFPSNFLLGKGTARGPRALGNLLLCLGWMGKITDKLGT